MSNQINLIHRIAVGLFLLLTIQPLLAVNLTFKVNAPETQPVDVDQRIPKGQPAGEYDVALLIGNGSYGNKGMPDVDFAHNDVQVMKRYLINTMGYRPENVLVETDITKGGFETLFGTQQSSRGKLGRYVMPGESRVFVYYVGHGAPDVNTHDGFFVPVDADPDYIANSGYALSTFYASLRKLPAKELIVVLDACFSGRTQEGQLIRNVSPGLLMVKDTHSGIHQGAVFSSATGNQLSSWYPKKRHSLFTYYFLKGLQGEADANKDKQITTGELNAYVAKHVRYMAGRLAGKDQEPKMEGKDDLVLATLK
ncbi:MAG: caspase family protein [Candidatus Thiodiazotropha taylori]|nr:caspase family protein [Candidatus Thiodiazotropha taylori]